MCLSARISTGIKSQRLVDRLINESLTTTYHPVLINFLHKPLDQLVRQVMPDAMSGSSCYITPCNTDVMFFMSWREGKPKKVIVCFIGGLTYSEMTAAYQVSAETGVDVLIGGDEILAPSA